MTEQELSDDRAVADVPWATVFDAAANVRALGAVQAQGFRAASRLVDRFVKSGNAGQEKDTPDGAGSGGVSHGGETGGESRASVDRLVDGWESLTRQLSRTLSNSVAGERRPPVFDIAGAESSGAVTLVGGADVAAITEVWLHNGGSEHLGEVGLRCSDLLTHDGAVITSGAVRFDPVPVPLPARSSRGVVVGVAVPVGAGPGVYRGTLLVVGHPDIWMPIELTVRPSS